MDDYLEHKRVMVLGLTFECPICDTHTDCPLREIRKSSSALEKHKFVKELSVEQVEEIYRHHDVCLEEREMNRILNEQLKRPAQK